MALNIIATICFSFALIHTFLVKIFQRRASKYPSGSVGENFFHLLGEIEVVFGLWSLVFFILYMLIENKAEAIQYIESRNYTEPAFVFVIMTICATKPILKIVNRIIDISSSLIPVDKHLAFFFSTFVIGSVLGSLITEPAAMTVLALILSDRYFSHSSSEKFKYSLISLLFVSISIGGTLTSFAAPPVLMVANVWGWDSVFMLKNFGLKAVISICVSTIFLLLIFKDEIILSSQRYEKTRKNEQDIPVWVTIVHLGFLFITIIMSHHPIIFMGIFLFFLGVYSVTQEYHSNLKIKEALLVAFFLAGLVVLGGKQSWWLTPVITNLSSGMLYGASILLTAVTDNAAITYLGSQISTISEEAKYFLVAGAVTGGGLTVIANAPNPAGYGILNKHFGKSGISPLLLFIYALPMTLFTALVFLF